MHDDLQFTATSSHTPNRGGTDKCLVGYSTIQFVSQIHGTLFLAYGDREYRLQSGEWFFPAHPGPRIRFHAVGATDFWHHRHIGFRGPRVERWKAAGIWPEAPQPAPSGSDWPARVDELIALVRRDDHWGHLRAINHLEGLLLELAEVRAQNPAHNRWLEGILERMNGEDPPHFDEIARELGLSPSVLRRRFKAAAGVSMQEYRLQKRSATARALLADTDLPLKTIATRLGYQNESFFSRQFRQLNGVAPGAFRRQRGLG